MSMKRPPGVRFAAALIFWAGAYSLLWWVISEGATDSLGIGIFIVFAATAWRTAASRDGHTVHLLGLVQFLPFFLWFSLKGASVVALRALQRDLKIRPVVVELPRCLPSGAPHDLFLLSLGLFPGSMGIDDDGDRVHVHILDRNGGFQAELRLLEDRVAAMFGLDPAARGGTSAEV
jgi:multicomponent Na+:H+ antiporter subunit E